VVLKVDITIITHTEHPQLKIFPRAHGYSIILSGMWGKEKWS